MKTSVIILNYNGKKYLEKFLPILIAHTPDVEIIIVDNASDDDSVLFLKQQFPLLRLIIFSKNFGFAQGYRLALQQIESDIFVLLNSDIEVTDNWLSPLVDFLAQNHNVAAVQPKIKSYHQKQYFEHAGASGGFLDKYGYPFCRGRIFDFCEKDEKQYNKNIPIFWATGACLVIKKNAYFEAGELDGYFFAHMEEIDLCWRLQNLGYEIYCIPESEIYHVGGGTLDKSNPFKTYLNFRNNLVMIFKNHPNYLLILFVRFFLDTLAWLVFLLKRKPKHSWAITKAYFGFFKYIFSTKNKNMTIKKEKFNTQIGKNKLWKKSIVWEYFIKKRKKFEG
ncbi:MAG: glycosyltransferase family 2 protein [Bacteroidetes bacterium]|nr:MAG: glycosyltransferase family 2 protein [Bacteroidota bacterium]TAG95204.1 MAG: glycosyltransferase family 2 protein [Bacteroidota bacterium]